MSTAFRPQVDAQPRLQEADAMLTSDEAEPNIANGRIIIAPIRPCREGWFEGCRADEDLDAWSEPEQIGALPEDARGRR